MKVKNILENVAIFLEMDDIYKYLTSSESVTLTDANQVVLNKLVKCVNLVNNIIATEYVPICITSGLMNVGISGINISTINSKVIYDIRKVTDRFGNIVHYTISNNKLYADEKYVYITYMVYPSDVTIGSDIKDYACKVSERVFAMGVCAEYLYMVGDIDTASSWDTRFKQSIINCVRRKQPTRIKSRLWY